MAIVTFFSDGVQQVVNIGSKLVKAELIIDFSKKAVSAADVVETLNIPKGALVLQAGACIITAEGATCTATLGDGDDPDGYSATLDLNSADSYVIGIPATDQLLINGGKLYVADDTIDLVMGHDTDTARVAVFAVYAVIEALYNSEV